MPYFLEFVCYFGGIQEKTEERSQRVEDFGSEAFQEHLQTWKTSQSSEITS